LGGVIHWINDWSHTAGFGGAAAVVASVIAYLAARRGAGSHAEQAQEDRWWDQAKWATEQLVGDDLSAGMGLAALQYLLDEAPSSQAGGFVRMAVMPIIEASVEEEVDPAPVGQAE
jgi:hypothetical protein